MNLYRDRLPVTDSIVAETIHSGFAIYREADKDVEYAPPSRLRRYDLFLIDEASQIDDAVARKLFMAILELPQKPFTVISADFQQLNPMAGGELVRRLVDRLPCQELKTIHRTKDPVLRDFSMRVRFTQPMKQEVRDFFAGRRYTAPLWRAVQDGLDWSAATGLFFIWLCVTNAGADSVNRAALSCYGVSDDDFARGYPGEPKVRSLPIVAIVGLTIRLTRNLDKDCDCYHRQHLDRVFVIIIVTIVLSRCHAIVAFVVLSSLRGPRLRQRRRGHYREVLQRPRLRYSPIDGRPRAAPSRVQRRRGAVPACYLWLCNNDPACAGLDAGRRVHLVRSLLSTRARLWVRRRVALPDTSWRVSLWAYPAERLASCRRRP